jgi:hypothetical protein
MRTLAGTSEDRARRVFAGLKAVSSLGNVIVVTFTAARGPCIIHHSTLLSFNKTIHANNLISKTRDRQ